MPTYEYHCDACSHNFDEFQSMTADPLRDCPQCGKPQLRRVFGTGAAILFKGSGFYQTDYRSESYKSAAKADQEAAKPASTSASKEDGKAGTTSTTAPSSAPVAGASKKD